MSLLKRLFGTTPVLQARNPPVDDHSFAQSSIILVAFLCLLSKKSGTHQSDNLQFAGRLLYHFCVKAMGHPQSLQWCLGRLEEMNDDVFEDEFDEEAFCDDFLSVNKMLMSEMRSSILVYLAAFNFWLTANYGHAKDNEEYIQTRVEIIEKYQRFSGRFEHSPTKDEIHSISHSAERLLEEIMKLK